MQRGLKRVQPGESVKFAGARHAQQGAVFAGGMLRSMAFNIHIQHLQSFKSPNRKLLACHGRSAVPLGLPEAASSPRLAAAPRLHLHH